MLCTSMCWVLMSEFLGSLCLCWVVLNVHWTSLHSLCSGTWGTHYLASSDASWCNKMIWYCCKRKHLKIYLSTNFRNFRNREVTLSNVHVFTSEFTLPHSEVFSMYVLPRGSDYTVTINRKWSMCVNILVRKVLCFISVWTHWFKGGLGTVYDVRVLFCNKHSVTFL